MLFNRDNELKVIAAIKAGFTAWTKDELQAILQLSRKPPALDEVSIGVQQRYRGNSKQFVEDLLKERFPETENMPITAVNFLKFWARADAGVYVLESDRWLDDADGNRIPNDDPRGKLWNWALKKSRFHVRMSELERRALIPPGVGFAFCVWVKPPGDPIGYPRIDIYWLHDVEALCHWQAPTDWAFKYVVAIRQAAPSTDTDATWYRVFSRDPPETIDGKWGPWKTALISTAGEVAASSGEPETYEGDVFPGFLVHLTEPEGYTFPCEDKDLVVSADDLNARRVNESYVDGFQGHDQMWTDDVKETASLKTGPDAMLRVMPGAEVGVLSYNPKTADSRESRELAMREVAISRGNSPDQYATKPGPPLSGVAKRVANLAHDTRVAEQATLMQSIEEAEPLTILKDMVMAFHPDGKILKDTTPRMNPRLLPTFEEPLQQQLRLDADVKAGRITNAQAAVEMGSYPDIDTAEKALKKIEESKPKPPPAPPPPGPPPPGPPPPGDPPVDPKDVPPGDPPNPPKGDA